MGTLYADTGGNAANSGSSDNNNADLTGTAAVFVSGTTVSLLTDNPDLSALVIAGATQSTINIAGATNANRTIFWITAFDNTAGVKTVTLDVAPTGMTTNAWKIGGQYLWPSAATVNVMEGALGLGENSAPDILQFNQDPASKTVTYLTARVAGNSTKGDVVVQGKAGALRLLLSTNTTVPLTIGQAYWTIKNLELQQQGASGNTFTASGSNVLIIGCKVSDGGAIGINNTGSGGRLTKSEISGVLTTGIVAGEKALLLGNYIHDNSGDGALFSSNPTAVTAIFNIIDTNAGRGLFISGGMSANTVSPTHIINNTIYNNGNSGLEVTDADAYLHVLNNIFQNNGNAAGEYNFEYAAGTAEANGFHMYNCFNTASAGGSGNLSGVTADATDITTDPSFTDAANGDFSLSSSSPCKATGYPGQLLGGNLGYLDMGAVQRQEPTGGSGGGSVFGAVGGVIA